MSIEIIQSYGKEELAYVYLANLNDKGIVEFVESLQPPYTREQKWVLILSVSYGCPIKCMICDAKIDYRGKLTTDEMLAQIDYMVKKRFPDYFVPIPKFKIQFARMGEPSLNNNVLEILEILPKKYKAAGIIPCISTIAPEKTDYFFEELIEIKNIIYNNDNFQLQFSIHTTDDKIRDEIIPVKKWDFSRIADYGRKFKGKDRKKITLNFALADSFPVDINIIKKYFEPDNFLVKITPLNPTVSVSKNNLRSYIDPLDSDKRYPLIEEFRKNEYEVILSIGENEENQIGSNCGQYITEYLNNNLKMQNSYQTDEYKIAG